MGEWFVLFCFFLTLAERYSFKLTKDVFFPHLKMLQMKMCYLYFSILKHYFYYAYRSTVNSIKPCAATILGYDNQCIFETKILGFFCNTEFDTSGNLFLCRLRKKKSGLRWFEPVESLVAKPSAVTKIKTAPQRARERDGARARVCVCL